MLNCHPAHCLFDEFFRIFSVGEPKKNRQIEMRKLTPFLLEIADFLSSTIDTITDLIQVRRYSYSCRIQIIFFNLLNFNYLQVIVPLPLPKM